MIEYLNEDEQLYVQSACDFRDREIATANLDHKSFPTDLVLKAGELGFNLLKLPTEYGGMDISTLGYMTVIYEMSKVPSVIPTVMNHQNDAARMTAQYCTEAQKDKFLDGITSGKRIMGLSATDPAGATNYPQWADMAHTEGDEVVINGSKLYMTLGKPCSTTLLSCKIDGERQMVFVDLDAPGVTRGETVTHIGGSSETGMCTIEFDNVRVPKEDIFPGKSLASDLKSATSYLGLCAMAVGNAEGMLEKARQYALDRERYGKPLASFQAVAHRLVNMKTTLDVAKAWIADAAWRVDQGNGEIIRFFQGKMWIPEACFNIVKECITLHGGLGLDEEMGFGAYQAFAQKTLFMERPADIHRDMVASLMGLPVDFVW